MIYARYLWNLCSHRCLLWIYVLRFWSNWTDLTTAHVSNTHAWALILIENHKLLPMGLISMEFSLKNFSSFSHCSGKKNGLFFHATAVGFQEREEKRQKQLISIQEKKLKNLWTYRWQNTWSLNIHAVYVALWVCARTFLSSLYRPAGKEEIFSINIFFLCAILNMNRVCSRGFSSRPARAWVNTNKCKLTTFAGSVASARNPFGYGTP